MIGSISAADNPVIGNDSALPQVDDPGAQASGFCPAVGSKDSGYTLVGTERELPLQKLHPLCIKIVCRFIQKKQFWFFCQGNGQSQSTAHTLRKPPQLAFGTIKPYYGK